MIIITTMHLSEVVCRQKSAGHYKIECNSGACYHERDDQLCLACNGVFQRRR